RFMPEALSIIEMVMTSDRKHCRYDKVNRFLDQCPRSVQLADRIDLALRPSVTRLLERFTDLPAMVTSAKGDVLAQNPRARELIGDLEQPAQGPANIPWQRFLGG